MDLVAIQASNNPTSQVYVMIYEGKEPGKEGLRFPALGSARAKIRSIRKYLKTKGVPPDRIKFVNAGFMEKSTLQVWMLPEGSVQPRPEPTLTKMRYRKGKPVGYCMSCCGP